MKAEKRFLASGSKEPTNGGMGVGYYLSKPLLVWAQGVCGTRLINRRGTGANSPKNPIRGGMIAASPKLDVTVPATASVEGLETALSKAVTAAIFVPADERLAFVGRHLLSQLDGSAPPESPSRLSRVTVPCASVAWLGAHVGASHVSGTRLNQTNIKRILRPAKRHGRRPAPHVSYLTWFKVSG